MLIGGGGATMQFLLPQLAQVEWIYEILFVFGHAMILVGVDLIRLEVDVLRVFRVKFILDFVQIEFCCQVVDLLCLAFEILNVFGCPLDYLVLA
jgi:hypothetical protein